jgi:hypothetical protein
MGESWNSNSLGMSSKIRGTKKNNLIKLNIKNPH